MDIGKFNEIIDFAIEREDEAVKFYHKLLENADFFDLKEMLREFELMERGHITILEKLRQREVAGLKAVKVETLKISEYLVPPPILENMSFQDILITAMKREELSQRLYTDLASDIDDPEMQQVFEKLASEEARHKLKFERLYDDEILTEN